MASPTDVRKGKVIRYQGVPHLVTDMIHRTQGRQAGFVQVGLKNLENGAGTNTKLRSTDTVEILHTENRSLEYSYEDAEGLHFMHPETFEDTVLPAALLEDQKSFFVENKTYSILFIEDRPVRVDLPSSVEMEVVEAPEGLRGDTANNPQKTVKVETGMEVQAPLFIKTGDVIKISTDNRSYLGRVAGG